MKIILNSQMMTFEEIRRIVASQGEVEISFHDDVIKRVKLSQENFQRWYDKKIPIYGVTTGFGDSCHRGVRPEDSRELQDNLISYLMMGTGKVLSQEASASVLLFRIVSLSRGFSGVSLELLDKMKELFNKRIYPVIPREGSLGASGDLIPLAYLANNIRGQGQVYYQNEICQLEDLVNDGIYTPHDFAPKEGLAIVNGTTTMAAQSFHNVNLARYLQELSVLCTGWLCLTLQGRKEAFSPLVNDLAKTFKGQSVVAEKIRFILDQENFQSPSYQDISMKGEHTTHLIQDPYSLRCAPQVMGPVFDSLETFSAWLETEINGVSDNPLFDQEESIANGGNFYGGYLAHSMDYLKICIANMADLMDRQLTLLISEKTNRGLTPNLASWKGLNPQDRHLHHGLKAVHQSASALTSEIMAKAMPNTIFSRSSESHNQDKVSLGMSAAVQCSEQLEQMVSLLSGYLCCLAQAIDLRGIELQGDISRRYYEIVRKNIPFVEKDQRLDLGIAKLRESLLKDAKENGHVFV